ncbi:hypothetical protein Patl1_26298 [Pistacia atlantica]|uniref:Uncharacterized protein n=1 Tax=Pistacia atlantica TaxID=434234 RepID=A0ACC1B415_9ROSI|nr:hypothetical protein Patl1_26298 [Pistacia atlantica]
MLSIRSILTSQRSLRPSKLSPFHSSCLCYSAAAVEAERTIREGPRHDWSKDEIKSIYDSPVLDLLFHGTSQCDVCFGWVIGIGFMAQVHRHAHNFREVQQCTLLSIKTGGCSEDCSYCPQSSRFDTGVKAQKLMAKETVMQAAQKAKEAGSTRFCMGAAWRDTIGRKTNFNNILEYVKEISKQKNNKKLEKQTYVTCPQYKLPLLPILCPPFIPSRDTGSMSYHMKKWEWRCAVHWACWRSSKALELKKAGLTAYNHNLDTSREYYPNIITTRSYDERLETLKHVREAGINVCSGDLVLNFGI